MKKSSFLTPTRDCPVRSGVRLANRVVAQYETGDKGLSGSRLAKATSVSARPTTVSATVRRHYGWRASLDVPAHRKTPLLCSIGTG